MKNKSWISPIKDILFMYLAASKIIYWMDVASTADGLDGVWRTVLERLLYRDIVLILILIFMYLFEKVIILKQGKFRLRGVWPHVILAICGYVVYVAILTGYSLLFHLIYSEPFDLRAFLFSRFMLNGTIIFFVVMVALTVKDYFKQKSASEYALDIQSTDIKLEMLETLLDDGVLSHDDYEEQRSKLVLNSSRAIPLV